MVPNATASDLQRLLDLQSEDSAIKRLEERKASLPEAQRLAEVTEQLAELDADIQMASGRLQEVARDYDKLEGEIEIAQAKITKEEQRLFSGGVSNPKELGALQAEVEMLKRKQSDLEDRLLEVMEAREQATATLERLRQEHAAATESSDHLTDDVTRLTSEVDTELQEHVGRRGEIAAEIDPGVLTLYEQIRATKGGIGAAALESGTCQGCHTKLPNKEVERLRAEGGLQRCDNCRRILVVS